MSIAKSTLNKFKTVKVGDSVYYRNTEWPGSLFMFGYIAGETSRSWLVVPSWDSWEKSDLGRYAKFIPKSLKNFELGTAEQADLKLWAMHHLHRIKELMGRLYDVDKILAIAKILEYSELPEGHNATSETDVTRTKTSDSQS